MSPPTRLLANIPIPSTPLITASIAYARAHLSDLAYNHIMRTLLFGFAIAANTPALQPRNQTVHALAHILHDLGWDTTGALISPDKRFEVDGANAARDFVHREAEAAGAGAADEWDEHALQLLWDAIALHTTPSIAFHKQPEVAATAWGILADFVGPEGIPGRALSWEQYREIVKLFPRDGFREGMREILCGLCRTKPATTWDNFVGEFGERFHVEGYSLEGKRAVDLLEMGRLD